MRKLQTGNRWKTQFVTLHREEVRRLQESEKKNTLENGGNSVQEFISSLPDYQQNIQGYTEERLVS